MKCLRAAVMLVGLLAVAACSVPQDIQDNGAIAADGFPRRLGAQEAARQFALVVDTVEPVAERYCRAARADQKCNFKIVIDTRRSRAPNAYQTLDENGNPVLIFTLSLISDMRNPDELAFVMSHEAAHHIRNHLTRQHESADRASKLFGDAAARKGATKAEIRRAVQVGAELGARRFSKEFELEADSLGAKIAKAAGYDPLRGALYFERLPDPGEEFLGSHPANAQRMATVRKAIGLH